MNARRSSSDPTGRRTLVEGHLSATLVGDAGAPWGRSLQELFDELCGLVPARFLRRMPARETFAWEPERPGGPGARPGGERFVVKRFPADAGERRDRWYERLRGRAVRSPARREFENLLGLGALGAPRVPRAVALLEESAPARRGGLGQAGRTAQTGRCVVVMERLAPAVEVRSLLGTLDSGAASELVAAVARLTARLHAAGWYHRDLYLQHWLLIEAAGLSLDERLALIDVGRARRERRPRTRWFVKDLAGLWHSAPASESGRATHVDLEDLVRSYLVAREGSAPTQGSVARLARRVRAKSARLAKHAPRHVDTQSGPLHGSLPRSSDGDPLELEPGPPAASEAKRLLRPRAAARARAAPSPDGGEPPR